MPHTHPKGCRATENKRCWLGHMLAPGVIAGVLWRASAAFHLEIESACGFLKVVRTAEFQPEQEGKKNLSYFCLDSENSRLDRRQKASKFSSLRDKRAERNISTAYFSPPSASHERASWRTAEQTMGEGGLGPGRSGSRWLIETWNRSSSTGQPLAFGASSPGQPLLRPGTLPG